MQENGGYSKFKGTRNRVPRLLSVTAATVMRAERSRLAKPVLCCVVCVVATATVALITAVKRRRVARATARMALTATEAASLTTATVIATASCTAAAVITAVSLTTATLLAMTTARATE